MAAPPSPPASAPPRLGAVVLAGGTGRRLGGADKASLTFAGATLLDRALDALAAAPEVVVVGPAAGARPPTPRPVAWTHEEPPGGGPAAGLLAGTDALLSSPELVCVLAVDMPRVTARTFVRLVREVHGADGIDGALLVDADGRRQPLCAVYRRSALERVRPAARAAAHGLPVRRLLAPLRLAEVAAAPGEAHDVDTWDDLTERPGR